MTIGKDEVLEVLVDLRILSIRFSVGPINVNVDEYNRVADFIDSGAIKIKVTKDTNHYVPEANTLFLHDGDSRGDFSIRSGILHECTHIVSDINQVKVGRLHDEAAAYLAQFSFLKLLDPSIEAPPIRGQPLYDLMRVGLNLVAQYGLGQPKGFGAIISPSDIDTLGRLVQRIPDYSQVKEGDQLAADGVDLTEKQMVAHSTNEMARLADKTRYEAWLLSTLAAAGTGGVQKQSAYAQLLNHFLMVYQPVATVLLARLSAVKKGDPLSERFDSAFTTQEKFQLLDALRAPKPPG